MVSPPPPLPSRPRALLSCVAKDRFALFLALGIDILTGPNAQSFLFIQLVFSFTPVALFASFALGTILFSFITALLFSLFWIFVTVSLGIAVWIWAVSSFLVSRWAYNMIPLSVRGGMAVDMPNGKTVVVNKTGDGYGV